MNKKIISLLVIMLFFLTFPNISGSQLKDEIKSEISFKDTMNTQDDILVTSYTLGLHERLTKEIKIPYCEVEDLFNKISEYSIEFAHNPQSQETQQLLKNIIRLSDEQDLLPDYMSIEAPKNGFNPFLNSKDANIIPSTILENKASAFFCNFATTGTGSQFPIIILPRLIPILLMPIPRVFLRWSATDGITSCGGMSSGKGFIAYGQQKGLALGFWGVGFSVFLPPIMQYGFIGYALFASAEADEIELWPPNSQPIITPIEPNDGEINVPLSLSELRFQISDYDGDLTSYTVTTEPDIGSDSGNLKPDGVYSVSVSGLEDLTDYSWHVEVTDGTDTTIEDFTFITEANAPIISEPFPKDDSCHTDTNLSQLSFHLKDFQGDPMDYTVETYPYIGSGGETGVGDGLYTISVNEIDFDTEYTWYVNVTDGIHWTYKVFHFKTRLEPGPWWNEIWPYRKYLGIMDASFDCQIVLKVWKEDGHDYPDNEEIDCEDNCNVNFSDLRFVTFNGVNCKYWIEKTGVGGGDHYAIIWVKLPSSGDEQLYLYYGNPDASDESNGDDTFIFFDDFEGDDYNHDIWETTGSAHTWTVSNSIMTMQSTGDPGSQGAHFILKPEAKITAPDGHMWYTKLSTKRDPNSWASMPYIGSYSSDSSPDDDRMYMWYRSAGGDHMRTDYVFNGVSGGANDDISNECWTDDAWNYFIMRRNPNAPFASYQILKEDKTQWGNKVEIILDYYDDFSPFEFYYYQRPYTSGGNTKIDWVFVAKYGYPPPSWENYGLEELVQFIN